MAFVRVFTDGSCSPNPGPGGWAAILIVSGKPDIELSGFDGEATNNRMELMGPIMALEHLAASSNVVIVSDSKYVVDGATFWMPKWRKRGWRKGVGDFSSAPMNLDLWQRLDRALGGHHVRFQWVRGHIGNEENERADRLAGLAREEGRRTWAPEKGDAGQPDQMSLFGS